MTTSDERAAAIEAMVHAMAPETAAQEAKAYCAWLNRHGYEASLWQFLTAVDNYQGARQGHAHGYAVRYAGTLVRDDGSTAEYPTAGVAVFCQDTQLALGNLTFHGRALVTFGDGNREYGPYVPYYVAGWNNHGTQDTAGVVPVAILHELTPLIPGDGPKRFYDLRLDPAGLFVPGDRVLVAAGEYAGETVTIRPGKSADIVGPSVMAETSSGHYRFLPVTALAAQ